jgi:DNA-binding transcriptional ArsR family regulator
VWNALVRTAASASQRQWHYAEWAALVSEPTSTLGFAARRERGRARSDADYERTLQNVWARAVRWVASRPPPFQPCDIAERVSDVRRVLADTSAPLDEQERAVLAFACDTAEQVGTDRPALPRRAVVVATGLGERTVRTVLARLESKGLLHLAEQGRSSGPGARRRLANLYKLPTASAITDLYQYRETRSVGQPRQVCGTSTVGEPGTTCNGCGTSTGTRRPDCCPQPSQPASVVVRLSGADATRLAATVARMRAKDDLVVDVIESN